MEQFINKKVIIRSDRAGVFFGTLDKVIDNTNVILSNARKLYYWNGACAVEEIAVNGVTNPENCKFTVTVDIIGITGCIQILSCSEDSIKSINSVKEWKKK